LPERYLIGLAAIFLIGMLARWIAWRLHLPSILLLLIAGIIVGPLSGFLNPDELFGNLLAPLVSISVGVILFEGGLSLRVADLLQIGGAVRNLVTVGVAITWLLASGAAWLVVGLDIRLAVLLGAILVVTGPTVSFGGKEF
jgi:NhaP-type Na+/H+ or K+/H+ antiporter